MIHLLWTIISLMLSLMCLTPYVAHSNQQMTCPARVHSNVRTRKCSKSCLSHNGCRSRLKRCLCDGECGRSCINPNLKCHKLNKHIFNGRVHLSRMNLFGSTAEYICDRDYVVKGAKYRVCRGDRAWSNDEPVCIKQSTAKNKCGSPPDIRKAKPVSQSSVTSYDIGQTVLYRCLRGFKAAGKSISRAFCMYDGQWVGPDITCIFAGCKNIVLSKGSVDYNDTLPFYGTIASHYCRPGYILKGPITRHCLKSGKWSLKPPTCIPVLCGSPPVILHARIKTFTPATNHSQGSRVAYQCLRGYSLQGDPIAVCTVYGTWYGPHMQCFGAQCVEPVTVPHGVIHGSNFHHPSFIHYSCYRGYQLIGVANITCDSRGEWSNDPPRCDPISCSVLRTPTNGTKRGKSFTYLSEISFYCKKGFMNTGSTFRTCQHNGQWSGRPAKCVKIRCGPVPVIHNGYTTGHDYTVNSVHFYRCNMYTTLSGGSMHTTCLANGKWSNTPPICWGQCQVPEIENASVLDELAETWMNHNTSIVLRCHSGYQLVGDHMSRCHNGTWTSIPKCSPESCSTPPRISNSLTIYFSTDHSATVKYQCTVGFRLRGNPYIRCNYGHWVGQLPLCKEVYCRNPGSLQNGVVYKEGAKGNYTFEPYIYTIRHGLRIVYQCRKNYKLQGPLGATCVDSKWYPKEKPVCVSSSHPSFTQIWHIKRVFL